MDSTSVLIAFYHINMIENWKYLNIIVYYHSKVRPKDLKQILDHIKKDLIWVANFKSEFDLIRKEKVQEILND